MPVLTRYATSPPLLTLAVLTMIIPTRYSRCTKIVSSPAPCHYAHLAAYSAHYNQPDFREKDEGDIKASRAAQPGELLHILPHLQDVLYYT